MNNKHYIFIFRSLIIISLYIFVLLSQWVYETKYTFNYLLEDITEYDIQIIKEAKDDKINIQQYRDIFIETKHIDFNIWFSKWNIFDWSETKYIKKEYRKKILKNLDYWRKTGKLPTYYNLNIKSTFNSGIKNGKNSSKYNRV